MNELVSLKTAIDNAEQALYKGKVKKFIAASVVFLGVSIFYLLLVLLLELQEDFWLMVLFFSLFIASSLPFYFLNEWLEIKLVSAQRHIFLKASDSFKEAWWKSLKKGDTFTVKKQIQLGFKAVNPGQKLMVFSHGDNTVSLINEGGSLADSELINLSFIDVSEYLDLIPVK